MTQGGSKTASRIDRCLTNMSATDLLDRHPIASTRDSVFDHTLSDHIPVLFTFHALENKGTNLAKSIPSWIAKHSYFIRHITSTMTINTSEGNEEFKFGGATNPAQQMCWIKETLFESAEETKKRIRAQGPTTIADKVDRCLRCTRAWREGKTWKVKKTIQNYPELAELFDIESGQPKDRHKLDNYIISIVHASIEYEQKQTTDDSSLDPTRKKAKLSRLAKIAKHWRATNRVAGLTGIRPPLEEEVAPVIEDEGPMAQAAAYLRQ